MYLVPFCLPGPPFHEDVAAGLVDLLVDLALALLLVAVEREADVHQAVDGVAHVDVQVRRALVRVEGAAVGDVHLGPQLRLEEGVRQVAGQVEHAVPERVVGHGERVDEVFEPGGHVLGDVVRGRPVLELEQHRGAVLLLEPLADVLEALPEELELALGYHVARETVDQRVTEPAKVAEEGLGGPEVLVQVARAIGNHHGLASSPLVLN